MIRDSQLLSCGGYQIGEEDYTGSEVDLANDKVDGTQISQVQSLVFESDSPQAHLLGFELSWGNYSHSGTN